MPHAMSTPASCGGSATGPAPSEIVEFAPCPGPYPPVISGRTDTAEGFIMYANRHGSKRGNQLKRFKIFTLKKKMAL